MRTALALPAFRRLAVAYTLNELGDWLATIALALLVFAHTGDALATTLLFLTAKFLPSLVVPVLATRAERMPVGRCVAALYVAEAVVFAALALSTTSFSLLLICVLAFADGALAATGRAVTRAATVAVLEPAGALREGNAVLNIGFAAMNVAAPAAAGFLVAAAGAGVALAAAGALFAVLAPVMATARGLPQGSTDEAPWGERLRAAAGYVRRHRTARTLIAGQAVVLVLFSMVAPIEVVFAKESLDAGDAGYGLLVTAWGVGLVIGSVAFARLTGRSLSALLAFSTLAVGAGYIAMGLSGTLAAACAAAVVGGAGNGVQWVAVITAVQESVSAEMQARVAGFLEAVLTAMPGLGFVLGGVLTAALSPRLAFGVAGGGVVAIVALGAVGARWLRARDHAAVTA